MSFSKLLFLVTLTKIIGCCHGLESMYFLSVDGSDDWDGTSESHVPETKIGPWQTLPHAVKTLRTLRPNPPENKDAVTVSFLPGTYFIKEKLNMDSRDSYMTFTSWSDGEVVISGGLEVLPTKSNKYKNNIKSVIFEGKCGESFLGDRRLIQARSPNGKWKEEASKNNLAIGPYHIIKDLLVETPDCTRDGNSNNCPDEDRNGFIFEDDLYSPDWEDVDQTLVLVFQSWVAEYAKIANITPSGADWKVLFQDPLAHAPVGQYVGPSGWRFLFFNNIALLDEPGEYVCVQRENMLAEFSFIPPETDNDINSWKADMPVIISQLGVVINMREVSNFMMTGLIFRHASSEGFTGANNFGSQTHIKVVKSTDISVQECEFSQVGMIGLFFHDCNKIEVAKNVFHDIGFHGLMIQSDALDFVIENNVFDGCGMNYFWSPSGLSINGRENITVRHNDVGNVPYAAMSVIGHRSVSDNLYRFKIEFNDFHDYGLGVLNDFGAIHLGNGNGCQTRNITQHKLHCGIYSHVYNNRIQKGESFQGGAVGLYSDNGSGKNTFENNLMYGPPGKSNSLYHHCGIDNLSKNNFIHKLSSDGATKPQTDNYHHIWPGCERHSEAAQYFENQHNIYLLDDVEMLRFGRDFDRYYDSAPRFHHNLYWSLAPGDAQAAKLYPDTLDWYGWQESGNDTDSKWQDPLFEDPLNHVYVLKENSPAFDLGIVQIDLDHFGPQDLDVIKRARKRTIN